MVMDMCLIARRRRPQGVGAPRANSREVIKAAVGILLGVLLVLVRPALVLVLALLVHTARAEALVVMMLRKATKRMMRARASMMKRDMRITRTKDMKRKNTRRRNTRRRNTRRRNTRRRNTRRTRARSMMRMGKRGMVKVDTTIMRGTDRDLKLVGIL
jgi:hypothetical protein